MALAKKGPKIDEPPKHSPIHLAFKEAKQIEADRRKAEQIERMIEAKVALALRLLH